MYLSRRKLYYIIAGLVLVIAIMGMAGCGTFNPSWGGSRW